MTTKTELTTEQLEEAVYFIEAGIPLFEASEVAAKALRYLAEILRGSEPVYQTRQGNGWYGCTKEFYENTLLEKRILYTHPQPVKKCEWKYSRLEEGWETQCKLHQYPSRLITFKFCPFCGGEIVEVK